MDTLDYSERKDLKPALLIINPVSGKRMVLRNVAQIIRVLMDAGYKVTTMITGKKGDGTAFAASFGRDYQLAATGRSTRSSTALRLRISTCRWATSPAAARTTSPHRTG